MPTEPDTCFLTQLHLEMIRQAEETDEREKQWTTEATKLRGQIADLTFANTQQATHVQEQVGVTSFQFQSHTNMCVLDG